MSGEADHRRLVAALAQRKHAESALWVLIGLPRMEPVEFYLSVLADVFHVAHHGVSRHTLDAMPDEAGRRARKLTPESRGPSRWVAINPKGESRPPDYDARAQALMRGMLKRLERDAQTTLLKLDEIVGEDATA